MVRSPEREQFLADIVITAVEGGTGYWAEVSQYKNETPSGTYAMLHEIEEPDEGGRELSLKNVAEALSDIRAGKVVMRADLLDCIKLADKENDAGEIDAEGADVIAQVALFGSIVYG